MLYLVEALDEGFNKTHIWFSLQWTEGRAFPAIYKQHYAFNDEPPAECDDCKEVVRKYRLGEDDD